MTYTLGDEKRKGFATYFLLDKIINKGASYPLLLDGDDSHLEELLTYAMSKGYVDIKDDRCYVATSRGREALLAHKERYKDFLKNFDVYCAVDLEEGDFAFEEYFEYEDEDLWDEFLEEERWEDLRVAVAEFKGIDPVEVVFMGMLNEGRINDKTDGWQFDLLLGSIWEEIIEICNSALTVADLAYEDESGETVSGESVLKDIIHQGSKLNRELWEEEEEQQPSARPGTAGIRRAATGSPGVRKAGSGGTVIRTVEARPISRDVYTRYADDPRYINPVWRKRFDD